MRYFRPPKPPSTCGERHLGSSRERTIDEGGMAILPCVHGMRGTHHATFSAADLVPFFTFGAPQ